MQSTQRSGVFHANRVYAPLEIEILPAGEAGPRHLDTTTVMKIQGIPFLTISEFIRAKLKTWMMYAVTVHTCLYSFVELIRSPVVVWSETLKTLPMRSLIIGIEWTLIEYLSKT